MNIFIANIIDKEAFLEAEESWHCSKVLRKKAGDKIAVIDGKGLYAEGILELVSDKKCKLQLTQDPVLQTKRNYQLHLAIAPTKQIDRIEWMIEKAVEIGLDEISFLQCKNSERVNLKIERIQKIVESAAKQSLQAYLPKVNGLMLYEQIIQKNNVEQKLIAHCNEGEKSNIVKVQFKNKNSLVLIGPEGDFTKEETIIAFSNNFKPISLGENRLRTETAGLYICQAAALLSQL
jgi:16S rRNA (uracil1498-N3)-methyltransferase